MSPITTDNLDSNILCSVIEHVFMPPKLPQSHPGEQKERKTNMALCNSLIEAAQHFLKILPSPASPLWMHMIKMIELARSVAKAPLKKANLRHMLSNMAIGDVFCMHIRAQNAAIIVRRLPTADLVQFEVFEVLPLMSAVMEAEGKLLCTYPGPAIQIPLDTFMNKRFLRELSSFLVQMNVDHLGSPPATALAESVHPKYISELLVGILRGYGQLAVVDRFTKRIGDEVLYSNNEHAPKEQIRSKLDQLLSRQDKESEHRPWRRSPLWLILRVTLQSSLSSSNLYKPFVLFFHAHLLRTCVHRDFPSELLYTMRVKMARRLSKLDPAASHGVHQFVHDIAKETEALLSKRWIAIQNAGSGDPTSRLHALDFVADTHISLHESYKYLTKVLRSASSQNFSRDQFIPSHRPRLNNVHKFSQFTKNRLSRAISNNPHIAISDFEFCVETNLESWVTASKNNNDAADVIASCAQEYFTGASKHFGSNAEDNSMMILTIMDLWVALDRIATHQCPLLKEYSPEIPPEFLHDLLLHRSSALKRASYVEEYLRLRHREARKFTSIFSNTYDDSCFAVEYFRTSESLQHLDYELFTRVTRQKPERHAELAFLCRKLTSLLREVSSMNHQKSNILGKTIHNPICPACQLERQAKALKETIFKLSLLLSMIHAQLGAFEMSPPRAFSAWRDMTYMILHDIGLHSATTSPQLAIDRPEILIGYFPVPRTPVVTGKRRQFHRLVIALTATLFPDQTGHNRAGIPVEDLMSFADSRLSFRLFDHNRRCWATVSFSESSLAKLCTPPIPKSSPYNHLHDFVSGTQHTPNGIIVAQAHCPDEINPHEFIAFAGLRSGPRLQWLNIARELASPYLTFSREEVHTLITQAAWQLGPLSNDTREWHMDLSTPNLGHALLRELETLLEKVHANWQEEVTVRTIVLICCRLLASTTDSDVSRQACTLLREARNTTYRWIGDVHTQLDLTQDETSRARMQRRLCMVAVTCFSTFDVCLEHVPATLSTEEDFSIAFQCAVIVHDNAPVDLSTPRYREEVLALSESEHYLQHYIDRMLRRHCRLLHDLEPIFSQSFGPNLGRDELLHSGAYDDALTKLWVGYRRHDSSNWRALPRPNSHWISCMTERKQTVHYNLLTGELLVGGKRLGRLPEMVVRHPSYTRIFGRRILDVIPADVPKMDYMTRSTVSGYQILFLLKKEILILQARKPGDSKIFQLIPHSVLSQDFPSSFVLEFMHWLDLSTGELEFRPVGSPWTPSPSNWRLYIQRPGILKRLKMRGKYPRAMLQKPSQNDAPTQLIDTRSTTFRVVSDLLSPLEYPTDIVVTYASQTLEVSLPRLQLSFPVKNGPIRVGSC